MATSRLALAACVLFFFGANSGDVTAVSARNSISTSKTQVVSQGASTTASDHHLVGCPDSPTPGKRPADSPCAIVAHTMFTELPKEPLVMRVETFATKAAAEKAALASSAVVEAAGKVWLLTIDTQGNRSKGGSFVSEVGPLSKISAAPKYELQVADADFGPEANAAISKAVHTHSGPEIWYVLSGAQCLETPNGVQRAAAGQGMFAPAETPMQLNIAGTTNREALFAIVHDATKPATTVSAWQPTGACQQ
jgi:mannose-6-phosphate isomerase-like protein (cupin superfamily)